MPYWENVTRSFSIAWRFKYLWLIALFSGETGSGSFGTGSGFNYPPRGGGPSRQQLADAQTNFSNWLSSHAGLVAVVVVVWLVVAIAIFLLEAICEGATVRASAEHDAERPFNLGWAWRSGLSTMWVIVRFRLFFVLLGLPVLAVFIGLAVSIYAAITGSAVAGAFIGLFTLLLLLAIPYLIYLSLLDRLGTRAVILEQLKARAGIVRGHRLLFKRLGRTLLVWLLAIAVAVIVGLALGLVLGIVFLPLVIVGLVIGAANSSAVVPLAVAGSLLLVVVSFAIGSFFAAQSSTYWTLAFRRLDVDYAPAVPYQAPPSAPAPPPAPTS